MTADHEPLLTTRDVAEYFCVNPRTIVRWATEGKLRYVRTPGGRRRYRQADVVAAVLASSPAGAAHNRVAPPERPALGRVWEHV